MVKTSGKDLQRQITADLITYLGEGTINVDHLARSIDYSGIEIENFDQLKQLHFVLYDDVVEYIERLPERLRRIKTEQHRTTTQTQGEVRGRINWQQTIQKRSQAGNTDRSLFMVDNPEIEIDIPENRIVKKFLAAISEPLTQEIQGLDQNWRAMWDDADILQLRRTLSQNVYLEALPSPDEISITDRNLTTARRARQALYYEAADLYRTYQDLMNNRFDREPVESVLRETLIAPVQDYKLFELFCVFALIRALESNNPGLRLQRVQPGTEEIARLESSDREIMIYYDEGGPLSFYTGYPKPAELTDTVPKVFRRQANAVEDHARLVEAFLSRGSQHAFYNGRPDFIVVDRDLRQSESALHEVIIGEIKYTQSPATFSEGLRELLEYLYLAESNDGYLFEGKLSNSSARGILCTDGVSSDTNRVEQIQHVTTDTLRKEFEVLN